jgi:TRAP-type C4-dicarboxylate transport system permease small subunit
MPEFEFFRSFSGGEGRVKRFGRKGMESVSGCEGTSKARKKEKEKLQTSTGLEKEHKDSGKLYKVISQIPENVLLLVLIVTLLDMLLSVFTRYITGQVIYWGEEVGTFGLVWITMIGVGVGIKRRVHFAMPTFMGRFPPRVRFAVDLINHALIMAFGVLMILTGYNVTRESANMSSPALEVNLGIINSAAIVAGVLIVLYEVGQALGTIRRGTAPSPEAH